MTVPAESIRCGVAGWSYPDWDGYVYERGMRDKLHYIAGFVDVLEINSTFYRMPEAELSRSWLHRLADCPNLKFTAKLHQDFTHGAVSDKAALEKYYAGLGPLLQAGRLLNVLAQFPWSFVDKDVNREHLQKLAEPLVGTVPVTAELRSKSWQTPEAVAFLAGLGIGVAELDYPSSSTGFQPDECNIGRNAYLRLHGRNTKAWFNKQAGRDETYNYLYEAEELDQIVRRALKLAATSDTLTVIANNHYQGKEMVNALEIKARLAQKKVRVPPPLMKAYPRLVSIASNPPEKELL